jgi:hypothetical protein
MPGEEAEIEIRPLFEAEDFGEEFTPHCARKKSVCAPKSSASTFRDAQSPLSEHRAGQSQPSKGGGRRRKQREKIPGSGPIPSRASSALLR